MKTLSDLVQYKGLESIAQLIETEVKSLSNIKFKSQKKNLAQKLNSIFNGYFLENFKKQEYGNFLSRALTAYILMKEFHIPENEAALHITDDTNDMGIDAIYYFNHNLYLFQTKFSNSISRDNIKDIKMGIHAILSLDDSLDTLNQHIQNKKYDLQKILLDDELKIVPVIVFFGQQIPNEITSFLTEEILNNSEYGEFIEKYIIINNEKIFEYEIQPRNVTEIFTLDRYFYRDTPIKMYVGCIKISYLKQLYQKYQNNLFSKNIRFLVDNSAINKKIKETLIEEADKFIYYNNGITFVCDNIKVLASSASSNNLKTLKVENLSIVNGAQTVLSCASVENITDDALVQIRIIETSLQPIENGLSFKITRFNNSQNSVSAMDLRTLDPIHDEIKKFFIKNNFYYTYRTGEYSENISNISFEDLMIALGCFYGYSRIVKNNKGELWSNDKLYLELLSLKNLPLFLALCEIKLLVDKEIENILKDERNKFIIHWNRLILELVFKKNNISIGNFLFEKNKISRAVDEIVYKINEFIDIKNKNRNLYHRQQNSYEEIKKFIFTNSLSTETEQLELNFLPF